MSLLVLLCVSAPTLIVIRRTKASVAAAVGLIAACSAVVWIYGQQRLKLFPRETSDIIIRIVQPSIPQTMKWDAASLENFFEYISLSRSKPLDDVDFVIWGETAVPYALDIEPGYRELLTAAVPPRGYLITGLVRYEFTAADRYRPLNSMFIIDKQGEIVNFYDKSHLVPFGEYIPLRRYLPEWVRPVANTVADFKPGKSHKTFKLKDYPAFGALICYEIIFPAQVVNKKQTTAVSGQSDQRRLVRNQRRPLSASGYRPSARRRGRHCRHSGRQHRNQFRNFSCRPNTRLSAAELSRNNRRTSSGKTVNYDLLRAIWQYRPAYILFC